MLYNSLTSSVKIAKSIIFNVLVDMHKLGSGSRELNHRYIFKEFSDDLEEKKLKNWTSKFKFFHHISKNSYIFP